MLPVAGRLVALLAVLSLWTPATGIAWADDEAQAVSESAEAGSADGGDHAASDHAASGPGHEESGHGHGGQDEAGTPPLLQVDFGSAIVNLAIFLGVLFVLSKFVWPVILGGLKAREDKIHGDLQAAQQANVEAKELLASYQAKLDAAANQVQAMLAEARKDAEASGQRIVAESKAEAERQRERAVAEIETAKKVALSDLAGQTSDLAIQVAKQVVGRELQAGDHAELIRQSLDRLPSHN